MDSIISRLTICRITFSYLPVEIQMMVFNHLYPDKQSLAHICLTCYNWKTITQNSYSWQLLQRGFNARAYAEEFFISNRVNNQTYTEEL